MRTDLFDFHLPEGRIAHVPAQPRDAAKLLHVSQMLNDRFVRDLPALLNAGDVLVMNDSRVIPARLFAEVNGRPVELLLHQPITGGGGARWRAFARPAKKLKAGMELHFAEGFMATVIGRSADGQVEVAFPYAAATLFEKLRTHGHMPLPPYITRADTAADATSYQTLYARADGSVAAPTAGLHFTPELMAALDARGIKKAYVTLHVGAGTFQPVKVADTDDHVMHREPIEIGRAACDTINAARAAGGKVVAVGTTSLRILESVAAADGTLAPFTGDTGIFITPGYRFKIVDRLMTNFHLPKSSLFMLVSAFCGLERMQEAYAHAMENDYRFYSYGDTTLLERAA
ncbi:MAG: tRNA preQ1(34) S-adenosylmethionine ribosyltransferase-isomerase QueA [Alphaproteobacteria bacterium]|nr:tRNA preQ1(34) S-adenosylmethionine ribosyltransferase-isomerase QueA [Alphaproteobacteria bacterium]